MAKAETAKLADSLQSALAAAVEKMDEEGAFRLRSEVSAVRATLAGGKRSEDLAASADRALASVGRFQSFASEVKAFVVSRDYASKASLYDIGSVGILAVENFLTAERKNLFRIVMSGLSEGLAFLASRQYIYGSSAVLEGLYRAHSGDVYDELWALATEFRGPLEEPAAREAQKGIDGFFAQLSSPGVPVDRRVSALYQLYAIVVLVRCADLLQRLRGARPPTNR